MATTTVTTAGGSGRRRRRRKGGWGRARSSEATTGGWGSRAAAGRAAMQGVQGSCEPRRAGRERPRACRPAPALAGRVATSQALTDKEPVHGATRRGLGGLETSGARFQERPIGVPSAGDVGADRRVRRGWQAAREASTKSSFLATLLLALAALLAVFSASRPAFPNSRDLAASVAVAEAAARPLQAPTTCRRRRRRLGPVPPPNPAPSRQCWRADRGGRLWGPWWPHGRPRRARQRQRCRRRRRSRSSAVPTADRAAAAMPQMMPITASRSGGRHAGGATAT